MADISKLEQQANLLFDNVVGWENSTLQRIGKRIKKYGKLSLADVKSINNIATVKQDMDAITKELAKVTVTTYHRLNRCMVSYWKNNILQISRYMITVERHILAVDYVE